MKKAFLFFLAVISILMLLSSTSLFSQDLQKIETKMNELGIKIMIGLQFQQKKDFVNARVEFEDALKLEDELKKMVSGIPGLEKTIDEQVITTLTSIAYCSKNCWDITKADKYYNIAIDLAEKNSNYLKAAEINCELASIYCQSGDYTNFEKNYLKVITLLSKSGITNNKQSNIKDSIVLLTVLDKLRSLYIDYFDMLYETRKFDEITKNINDQGFQKLQSSLNSINLEQLDSLYKNIALQFPKELPGILGMYFNINLSNISSNFLILTDKGSILRVNGEYEDALKAYEDAEDYLKSVNVSKMKQIIDYIRNDIKNNYKILGQNEQTMADKMLSELNSTEIDDLFSIFHINNKYHRARTYEKMRNYKKAMELYDDLIKNSEKIPYYKKFILPRIYCSMGETAFESGEFEKSLAFISKAESMFIESPFDLNPKWRIHTLIGMLSEKKGDLDNAYKAYEKAINIIEKIWLSHYIKMDQSREEFFGEKIVPFEGMIRISSKQGKPGKAFLFAEKSRARDLTEHFGLTILPMKMTSENKNEYYQLALEGDSLTKRIQKLYSSNEHADEKSIIAEKSRLLNKYDNFIERYFKYNSELANFVNASVITPEETPKLLDKDSVLLEYYFDSDLRMKSSEVFLWIITSAGMKELTLPISSNELRNNVRIMRKRIQSGKDDWKSVSKDLYQALIKPAENLISDKKRLIICPYKQLHYLPFAALLNSDGSPLIKKFSIVYIPSATALKFCFDKKAAQGKKMLAYALGNFPSKEFSSLPGTETEVSKISKLFPDIIILKGNDFNADIAKKELQGRNFIHFATHGVMNADNPKSSCLLMGNEKFTVEEILKLKMLAGLVVLSACETGLGKIFPGDDQVGLTRAFMFAGTPSIISSLWSVSDESTAKLMTHFYENLEKKMDKAEALREAELKIMEEFPEPSHWASFILNGDWR